MTELRRVRRVSLRAPSEALVRRGALLLEDALRTTSWAADVPGRVVVVRRLDVGAIDPDESPAALSTRIEARLRELGSRLVPADAPGAELAEAVFFRDSLQPAVMLVEHAARTAAPAPWFVQRALPAYRPDAGPRHALRAALASALETSPDGAVGLLEALLARGTAGPLLDALERRDGSLLLHALGLVAPPSRSDTTASRNDSKASRSDTKASRDDTKASRDDTKASRSDTKASRDDTKASRSDTNPSRDDTKPSRDDTKLSGDVALTARTAPEPASREAEFLAAGAAPVLPEPPVAAAFRAALAERVASWGAADARSTWLAAAALLSRSPALRHDPRLLQRAADLVRATLSAPERAASTGDRGGPPASVDFTPTKISFTEGDWSTCAGLLFLIPVLARLGMADALAEHPALAEAGLPLHVLLDVADRLDVPPDDPMRLALGAPALALPDVAFVAPAAFERFAGPRPLPLPARGGLAAVAAFRIAARRLVRRLARMGLRSLVLRPGRVLATRTHIDVVMDLRRAQLGVRRAGLDVDPGYVPWLGRVVSFHYRRGEEPLV